MSVSYAPPRGGGAGEQQRESLHVHIPACEGDASLSGPQQLCSSASLLWQVLCPDLSKKRGPNVRARKILADGRWGEQMKTVPSAALCQHWAVEELLCIGVCNRGWGGRVEEGAVWHEAEVRNGTQLCAGSSLDKLPALPMLFTLIQTRSSDMGLRHEMRIRTFLEWGIAWIKAQIWE